METTNGAAAEVAAAQVKTGADPLDVALERLPQFGYRIDKEKAARLIEAGLVPDAVRVSDTTLIARLRRILDIERMLAPWRDVDAIAFYLAASGVEDVPATPVARFLAASVDELRSAAAPFASGFLARADGGPDGEKRLARSMARAALARYKSSSRADAGAIEQLLSAALIAFVRLDVAVPRPAPQLHRRSRLVNLDAESAQEEGSAGARPALRRVDDLPPFIDRERLIVWIGSRSESDGVIPAVRRAAAMIRSRAQRFPELQVAWRDVAEAGGYPSLTALRAVGVVPAVLAASFLQAEATGVDPTDDPEHIVRRWGTIRVPALRFALATHAFPWVSRDQLETA